MPADSARTIIKNIHKNGIPAFEDRRFHTSTFLPQAQQSNQLKIDIQSEEEGICIGFGDDTQKVRIPGNNPLQLRALLLTLVNSELLSIQQASEHLQLSTVQTRTLAKKIQEEDVGCLMDKRKGHIKEYVFDSEIKAEMIQQYIANLVNNKKTSSQALSEDLKERCHIDLSSRTIRFHVEKMGLSKIRKSLPHLIDRFKKNSKR
jgi:hypothetical protein